MTKRGLDIFVSVCENGSMSKAAKALLITQSSVSQVIIDMEKEYNIVLFERLNNQLKLTPIGEEVYNYAKKILNLDSEMESVLKHESNRLFIRIGCTISVASTVMKNIILDIKKAYDSVEHHVIVANTHTIEKSILDNEVDIGLVEGRIQNPDLIQEKVIHDKMVLICGNTHKFYGRTSISIKELEGVSLIMREKGSGTREQFENVLRDHGVIPSITCESFSYEAIIVAVEAGLGVTVISQRLVEEEAQKGKLWISSINDVSFDRYFSIVYHKDKYFTKIMRTFVELCYDYGRKHDN